jgi:outer membrane receptor for ferrienterochelin and colicins
MVLGRSAFVISVVAWSLAVVPSMAVASDAAGEDLLSMDFEELLDVEISVASKKSESLTDAPGVVAAVAREEIDLYGDRNLFGLMQRQPSVYTRSSFPYSDNATAFRGDLVAHSSLHTLLLLNGRPIRESAQGHNFPINMAFPIEALEGIEVVRGPGSVLYGTNAFSGVVNLKSRSIPEQDRFSISAMTGDHGYYDTTVSLGGRSGDLGFTADVQTTGQGGDDYRLVDQLGVYGEADRFDRSISGVTHLEYQGLTFDMFAADMEMFSMGVMPFWSNTHHESRTKRLFANLGYRVALHERYNLEFNVTYNLQENVLAGPTAPWIGTNTSDILGEVTLLANPLDNLDVVLGFLQEYQSNYTPDDFQSIPSYDYEPRSAYAQGDYRIGDAVKLIAGTQWNESAQGYSDLISRYGVILTPFEKWGLKLLRGEAFRGPIAMESDLDDPLILVGNKDLEPEVITTHDVQLFYNDKYTYAAVTYFNSKIDKQIVFDPTASNPSTYMNGGEQEFDGIEFEGKHYLTPRWHVLGSFTHQESDADEGLDHTVVPENMFKLGTAYSWEWGSAAVFYTHYGTPPHVDSPLVVNPEPEAVNLVSLNVDIDTSQWMGLEKKQCVLTLRAENLLDEEVYVPTLAYTGSPNSFPYGPGMTFYAGLTYNF